MNMITLIKRLFAGNSHEHKYEIPVTVQGYKFMKCSHPGCNMHDPVEDPEEKERDRQLMERVNKYLAK